MLKRKVETCRYDLSTMAGGLLFHIPSQLQGSVLYSDYTDLHGRSKASVIGEFYLKFNVKNLPEV
jgi:hypothetical protein